MKRVLVATPSIDGRVEGNYSSSLATAVRHAGFNKIDLVPCILSKNSIIHFARNELLCIAREHNMDGILWVDSDVGFEPEWPTKLILSGEDVIGGAVPRKEATPSYTFRLIPGQPIKIDSRGYLEVAGNGTAFLYMSRKAMDFLWESGEPYDVYEGERRMAFDITVVDRRPRGEDFYACYKLRDAGYKIWLDTSMSCTHSGSHTWKGDLRKWLIEIAKDVKRRNT